MKASTFFTAYIVLVVTLLFGLAGLMYYTIEMSRWWQARVELAQNLHHLHLQLEANMFRLFKQHGDALLIGDRDGGIGEKQLQEQIASNIADIRNTIAAEIQMVGEQEIEELVALNEIQSNIAVVNDALTRFSAAGERFDNASQIERLASLLDREIDVSLTNQIEAAIAGEEQEIAEVVAESEVFHHRAILIIAIYMAAGCVALIAGIISFNRQVRHPISRLQENVERLQDGDYNIGKIESGSFEFRELGKIMHDMATSLYIREANRAEQKMELEEQISARTGELQVLVRQLETNEKQRERLMADISHELRTPLSIILGEAEVALRTGQEIEPGLSDSLSRIRDAAKHTNQIVENLLTIARQEAGELRINRRDVDLRDLMRDAVRLFPKPVALQLPPLPLRLSVDEVRIRQSVLALLQNARRYGGPNITARLEADDTIARLIVEDDGPGLSEEEKAQAFTRFYRGVNASGDASEGTGLGLPIVKSIVDAHRGKVELADADGSGLRVTISLPTQPNFKLIETAGTEKKERRA